MTTSSASRASSSNSRLIPPRLIASPLKTSASTLRLSVVQLPMHRFGHERIHGAGRRVDEARPAAQEKPVPEKDAQEIDRRIEHELERRRLPPLLQPLVGFEPGVGDF